ncbi:peptidoglycan DD-metalloendopeptidase family protein [Pararhodospirillum photometricum]|uniref:Peptidase M23B n=1 Tax=Pararhodospirillum photometricum DSM 122 TaxID=1150469 RepID=H6SJH0_PARPM|nr:peptidoglycan DD-metalloendopeptidase family protein [Pararhodospirillum photometricum]CCG08135.1 Peptidase M23B [Pararhodospirillum photometricum DSM 122]
MTPTARPVLYTLLGSVVGATCGALVFLTQPDTTVVATTADPSASPSLPSAFKPMPEDQTGSLPTALREEDHLAREPQSEAEENTPSIAGADWGNPPEAPPGTTASATPPVEASGDDLSAADPGDLPAGEQTTTETADASPESDTTPGPIEVTLTVGPGETLMGLLLDEDVPSPVAHAAIEALRETFDPRDFRAGQDVTLTYTSANNDDLTLQSLSFEPSVGTTITLNRGNDDSFSVEKQQAPLVRRVVRYDGTIHSSFFEAGLKAGAPQKVLAEMIRVFSYDIDFQRDLRENDHFEMFYEQMDTNDGRTVQTGDLLYASMTVSGKRVSLYRFQDSSGNVDYYNEKGQGIRKALLRTPINGARLTSGFGMRQHPILGYSKMHKGIDFAAPTGTPIYAAGDGVIERAERTNGYGNYVRLRHNGEFQTAYGHMSRFAKGVKPGLRVRQGEVIGFVGSTGRSTGPHLHYEILRDSAQVNPMNVRFAASKELTGKDLAAFQREREQVAVAFRSTPSGTKVASAH